MHYLKSGIPLFIITLAIHVNGQMKTGDLTIEEAMSANKFTKAVAEYVDYPDSEFYLPPGFMPPYTAIDPVKLADNLYFVGTNAVGSFLIDTGEGLVMLDAGCGESDAAIMAEGMKELFLDPSKIRLILLTHEHFDHYGGVEYLKKNFCPDVKVAMSLIGWNMLQNVPYANAYSGTRPHSVDIFLIDGMKIRVGNLVFQAIATPGHSAGCMSFIFPVYDNGKLHMAGVMGGSAVFPTHMETYLYGTSVEYFKAFTEKEKCDIGLYFHARESDFSAFRNRTANDPNPLIIGTEKFNSVYLQSFRNRYVKMIESHPSLP